MRISFFFSWYDFWVGVYWDRCQRVLYICPIPCFEFRIEWPRRPDDYAWDDPRRCKWGHLENKHKSYQMGLLGTDMMICVRCGRTKRTSHDS